MSIPLQGGTVPRESEFLGEPSIAMDVLTEFDATDWERPERAELLLSAIVDSSDDAIVSKDLNGIITSWNLGAERLFGYEAREVIGRPVTILIPPERWSEETEILSQLRRGNRVDHFETIRRRKDGTLLDISLTVSPIKDSTGHVIGASKIARNITERKRTEAALIASETRFRQLADSMPQIVWTATPDGYVDYYNERWFEFTGFPRDSFGDERWVDLLHPQDLDAARDQWSESIHSGNPFNIEVRFWDRRASRWRWFISRALPGRDSAGRITKWFGSCTDIDDQKHAQEELRRANDDLEQFGYSASHDLQEPLRSIKIYSQLLSERYGSHLDGDALQFLGFLQQGATRMEMLVRDLLTYTQIPGSERPTQPTDAQSAFDLTLESLAGSIAETGAVVTSSALPMLPVHNVHLHQLFQNLIQNAIKYRSPDRVPAIAVEAVREREQWHFTVTDNGIGIHSMYKEKIFGLFKRLHSEHDYSGTGIGLAICQRIVSRYQCRIWVESEPGKGSVFHFTLPA